MKSGAAFQIAPADLEYRTYAFNESGAMVSRFSERFASNLMVDETQNVLTGKTLASRKEDVANLSLVQADYHQASQRTGHYKTSIAMPS